MVDKMKEMYAWDMASRQGNVNTKGLTSRCTSSTTRRSTR